MSSIAFHTAEQTGYVSGAERAHLLVLVRDRAAALRREAFPSETPDRPSMLRDAVEWRHNALDGNWRTLEDRADLHLASSGQEWRIVLPSGLTRETVFNVDANSVLAAGSPSVQLATRIHAQCEAHMFVEGEDRAWFASAIETAVRDGAFRDEGWSRYPQWRDNPNGWQAVADLARADASGPMVLSYSVCDWFPNPTIAAWPEPLPNEDEDWDAALAADQAWGDLSASERWDRAVAGLRRKAQTAWMLRLTPDNLGSPSFGTETPLTWAEIAEAWDVSVKEQCPT
jgi:hypothetical protein